MSYPTTSFQNTAPNSNSSIWSGQVFVMPQQGDANAQEDDSWLQYEVYEGESIVYLCEAPTENEEGKENECKVKDK